MDLVEAHIPTEIRRPLAGQKGPFAARTKFGWTVFGDRSASSKGKLSCQAVSLDILLKSFFDVDTRASPVKEDGTFLCQSDKRALKILETTTKDLGERYEVGLLWASSNPSIPDNRSVAFQRLFATERRFARDPQYAENYSKIINEYINLGFARKLKQEELEGPIGRTNHLVHFGVTNPNKPGKLRVVFNAALPNQGTSLNELLLPGPDFLTSLVGVLIRFRVARIGVSADIEKMFLQVRVPECDQPALRFVWREPNSDKAPSTYQMLVHIFGATSSPACCTWALRKAALDQPEFNLHSKVVKNFYVDNYLDSFDQEEDATEHAERLTTMLKRKGFRLNQWLSSSRNVLNKIPATERAHEKLNIDLDRLPVERTLGMFWNCELDVFQFTFKLPLKVKTKREMFSAASSIFDPLGFVCLVVLPVKILMQEVWRRGISWNDPLPTDIKEKWDEWCRDLIASEGVKIPRCYRPIAFESSGYDLQLHVFSDASKDGYGAVAYLRYQRNDQIHVAFVIGKSRVAPVRQLTIPKLELNGAWTAVELARIVTRELDVKISKKFFWTDSTTVLHWVNSCRPRLEEFVANRKTHILNHSEPTEWNHVPGSQNTANDCSRGVKPT